MYIYIYIPKECSTLTHTPFLCSDSVPNVHVHIHIHTIKIKKGSILIHTPGLHIGYI